MSLKERGGWERIEMVQEYAHLAAYAENVNFWSNSIAQKRNATGKGGVKCLIPK